MASPVVVFVTGSVPNKHFQGRSTRANLKGAVDNFLRKRWNDFLRFQNPSGKSESLNDDDYSFLPVLVFARSQQ